MNFIIEYCGQSQLQNCESLKVWLRYGGSPARSLESEVPSSQVTEV